MEAVWVNVIELENVPPEVNEISYPVGAVTTISATKSIPETEKLCSEETEPKQLLKAVSVPEVVIVGVAFAVIDAVTAVLVAETQPVVVFLACA